MRRLAILSIKDINIKFLLRVDVFAILFLVLTTIVSFAGEYFFKIMGYYKDRSYNYSTYFFIFLLFLVFLILAFILVNRIAGKGPIEKRLNPVERRVLVGILLFFLVSFIPAELIYLYKMYLNYGSFREIEEVRVNLLITIPVFHRFFWYSSFLLGLGIGLVLIEKHFRFRSLLRALSLFHIILLAFYGSKYLIILPILCVILVASLYRKELKLSVGKFLKYCSAIMVIVVLGTVYTNFRHSGRLFMAENPLTDILATVAPEQRDGSFLIAKYGESLKEGDYLYKHLIVFLASLTHKRVVESLLGPIIDEINVNNFWYKILLNIPWYSYNPRIGIIGSSYLFGGSDGCFAIMLMFVIGLSVLYFILKLNINCGRRYYDLYFLILIFVNTLWTFNSDFITHLPFIFISIYFFIKFKIVFKVAFGSFHR